MRFKHLRSWLTPSSFSSANSLTLMLLVPGLALPAYAAGYSYFAAEATPSDPISALLQYGILGIFAAVLLWLARNLLKREQERADRLDAEVTRLNNLIQEKTVPALLAATQSIQASQEYFRAIQYQRDLEEQTAKALREERERRREEGSRG